ncbi:hypothetical protein [Mycobacteroides chelonae]|uniref:hypothetical protein n=1 Tax=Mycobacteroides chelonae TaxID=1774 RepID=UPI003204EE90
MTDFQVAGPHDPDMERALVEALIEGDEAKKHPNPEREAAQRKRLSKWVRSRIEAAGGGITVSYSPSSGSWEVRHPTYEAHSVKNKT